MLFKCMLNKTPHKILTKSVERKNVGKWYWAMVRACRVYQGQLLYARFQDPSYHRYRKRHFSFLLNKIMTSQLSVMKCRSREPGNGACL